MLPEAEFNSEPILAVDLATIERLKQAAARAPRRRYRLCLHASPSAATQEMIIVCPRGSFATPHRHPDGKSESYHVIEGSMTVCFLDDAGDMVQEVALAEAGRGQAMLYRLSASRWHMPVVTSDWLVYHETYSGPFERERDVLVHPAAPDERDAHAVRRFLERLGYADAASAYTR